MKKEKFKKAFAVLLALIMTTVMLPFTASASTMELTATTVVASGNTYTISTVEQLGHLADIVNGVGTVPQSDCSGVTFVLTDDIELGYWQDDNGDYIVDDGEIYDSLTNTVYTSSNWASIGDDTNAFAGTFDGSGHEISGIYISAASGYQGLFGYATGTIKNLGVTDSYISASVTPASDSTYTYIGSLAAYNTGEISGCYNTGRVNVTVNSAYDYSYIYIGCIAGYNTGTISDSYNTGSINVNVTITAGYNKRNYTYGGGVAGYNTGTVAGGYNNGSIDSNLSTNSYFSYSYIGGVAGYNSSGTISDCYNNHSINQTIDLYASKYSTAAQYIVGGVVGYNYKGTISNCYNTGAVNNSAEITKITYDVANLYAGGVVGCNGYQGTTSYCYNTGSVNASASDNSVNIYYKTIYAYVGGVTGHNYGTIYYCSNTGDVNANINLTGNGFNAYSFAYIGGVAGYNYSGSITYCHNAGSVNAYAYAHNNSGGHHGARSYVGGVVGYNRATVSYCYNIATTVRAEAGSNPNSYEQNFAFAYAGGVSGYAEAGTITYCYNAAAVTASAFDACAAKCIDYAGCVVGFKGGGTITSCYYDNEKCISGGINGVDTTGVAEGKSTADMQGDSLRTGESGNGWTDQHWLFEKSEYPVFGINIADESIVTAIADNQTYTGSAITTSLTLTNIKTGYSLQENTDYTVKGYSNNIDVGTATVSVKGSGDYICIRDITFTISPKDIGAPEITVSSIPGQTYTGGEIKPDFTITYNGMSLVEDTDYEIIGYSNNIDIGTATITVQGIGNFTGTRDITFAIVHGFNFIMCYDANGGSGTPPASVEKQPGQTTTIASDNGMTYTDYVFACWNTEPDGSGTDYIPSVTFTFPAEDTTLYAIWVKITIVADPGCIVGNGESTTQLNATVTNNSGEGISGVTVDFATSEYNDDGNFFSDEVCTETCRTAVTDADGVAKIYYRSTNLETLSTEPTIFSPVSFDVYATAEDATRDLYATDSFEITFVPGTLNGVLYDDTAGSYLAGTEISISLDNTDNGRVWSAILTTDANGEYSSYVPWSGETYTVSYVKTVETVGSDGNPVQTDITFSQTGTTDADAVGEGGIYDSQKTITGLVLKKDAETSSAMLLDRNDISNYTVSVYSGTDVSEGDTAVATTTLETNGQYAVTGLSVGTYTVVVTYEADGQTLLSGTRTVTISSDGEMTISEVLIDPYGTITDADTGEAIDDVAVTLYYADTARNASNGITANTVVSLPAVSGFAPNENGNPDTDADGKIKVAGLSNGTYYFVETAAPSGYELDSAKHTFTVSNANATLTVTNIKSSADTPSVLNSTDHFKYVYGYTDGTVRPNGNVTRAEVATMFYRLLTASARDVIFTGSNSFSDVSSDLWYNKAVSSLAGGGYVFGYPDGFFDGEQAITRAEFVAIASRFMGEQSQTVSFTDLPTAHWAYRYISTAVSYGWIEGYSDSTFRPDQPITRAEAMTIINRMLYRGVEADGVMTGFKAWQDNDSSAWYYYEVIEATNDHEYTGTRPSEQWTSLTADYTYDIAKYENP